MVLPSSAPSSGAITQKIHTLQSGLGDLKFADFLADTVLLREARALADRVIAEDPALSAEHAALRGLIHEEAPAAIQRG